jgi:hypothetical protein
VENAVGIVSRYLRGKLRNRRFFSLEELNCAIRKCVTIIINARVMKRLNKSRNELFATIDQPALNALTAEPYSYAEWKRCTVAPDYHVEVDKHYYSVPFRLLREVIEARHTDKTVELLQLFHRRKAPSDPGPARTGVGSRGEWARQSAAGLRVMRPRAGS